MAVRKGKTFTFEKNIRVTSSAGVAGRLEGEGPLGKCFDRIFEDSTMGELCWEKAESDMLYVAMQTALDKGKINEDELDGIFAGDLLNQCISSAFTMRSMGVPFVGMFGACSTMALSTISACMALESGSMSTCMSATSSHFCSAEKQFRFPLEFGAQRTPTAQRTVTGAGAMVIKESFSKAFPRIVSAHIGTVQDLGVTDSTNMGAAMAPVDVKIEP